MFLTQTFRNQQNIYLISEFLKKKIQKKNTFFFLKGSFFFFLLFYLLLNPLWMLPYDSRIAFATTLPPAPLPSTAKSCIASTSFTLFVGPGGGACFFSVPSIFRVFKKQHLLPNKTIGTGLGALFLAFYFQSRSISEFEWNLLKIDSVFFKKWEALYQNQDHAISQMYFQLKTWFRARTLEHLSKKFWIAIWKKKGYFFKKTGLISNVVLASILGEIKRSQTGIQAKRLFPLDEAQMRWKGPFWLLDCTSFLFQKEPKQRYFLKPWQKQVFLSFAPSFWDFEKAQRRIVIENTKARTLFWGRSQNRSDFQYFGKKATQVFLERLKWDLKDAQLCQLKSEPKK